MLSSVAFSHIMNPSSLIGRGLLFCLCAASFSFKCSSSWWRRMSHISGDGIAPMDAPIVWWYSLSLNEK